MPLNFSSLLVSNNKNFKRDLTLLIVFGIASYIIDIASSNGRYKECLQPIPQISILLHHVFGAISSLAWLSQNVYLIAFQSVISIGLLAHWLMNDWSCVWTEVTNEQCKTEGGFRSPANFLNLGWLGKKPVRITTFVLVLTFNVYRLLHFQKTN